MKVGRPCRPRSLWSFFGFRIGCVVTLEFDVAPTATLELRNLSYEWARVPLGADGLAFLANGNLGAYSLNKDA